MTKALTPLLMLAALGGCSTMDSGGSGSKPAMETISYTVSPCFGFCPVYAVEIADGTVRFDGQRYTAATGQREKPLSAAARAKAVAALAPFRPATGVETQTTCEAQATDMSNYAITWTAPDGTKTLLRHDRGCRSEKNERLNAVMDGLPAQLGIADWAKGTGRRN